MILLIIVLALPIIALPFIALYFVIKLAVKNAILEANDIMIEESSNEEMDK